MPFLKSTGTSRNSQFTQLAGESNTEKQSHRAAVVAASILGVHFGSDVGAALDTESFILNGGNPARYITWSIPAAVLQQWIDDPASNNGLLMNNQIAANLFDVTFNSVENTNPPILTFQTQAVPDSGGTLALLALSAFGALACFRRNGSKLQSAGRFYQTPRAKNE